MTAERFREIRVAFDSAVDLRPADREAFLRERRQFDPELAQELTALFEVHERRGRFIEGPVAAASGIRIETTSEFGRLPPDGAQVGPYRLLDFIGEGGMGEVWRAEQTSPVRRVVALKLIKAGMDTREVISRFESERQTLALMEHPAIAKVFDAGTTAERRPYIAMEYVAGEPINSYCDARRLPIRDRLKLFMRLCEGVQHAHQKAIIHRDLKPSNILITEVDGKAVPKIIDFGVARALSPGDSGITAITRIGSVLGTPDYMSPEQASGGADDIDTRTDVYSLGVVLYELMVGALPRELRGLPVGEMLRQVKEAEAPRPSARLRMLNFDSPAWRNRRSERGGLIATLRGDLDAIVLKAIDKDRRLRYDSATDFSGDVGRFLRNSPVSALRPSPVYFARKFVRRHRALVGIAAVFLVLAASFGYWQATELRRITRERDRADRIAGFMTDMFTISDPSASRGNAVTARQILDRASANIGSGLASDPELQAQLMNVMGRVYTRLGLFRESESLLHRSLDIRRRIFGTKNPDTAQAASDLGVALAEMGRMAEARKLDLEALEIRRALLGLAHPDTLKSMNNVAVDLVAEGRYSAAEPLQRAVLEARRRTLGPEAAATLRIMSNLGDTLGREGKFGQAEALLRVAWDAKKRLQGADHPETLHALHQLADTLYDEGRYSEAEALDRELLKARRKVLGPEHRETLTAMVGLANPLESEGRLAEAEQLDRSALDTQRRVLGNEHDDVTLTMNNLAGILAGEGRFAEAEKLDREAVAVRARVHGPEDPMTVISSDRLALVLERKGSLQEAEALARWAHARQVNLFGIGNPETANGAYTLACIAAHAHRSAEAIRLLREAVEHGLKPNIMLGLKEDSEFVSLRGDHDFQALAVLARQRSAEVSFH